MSEGRGRYCNCGAGPMSAEHHAPGCRSGHMWGVDIFTDPALAAADALAEAVGDEHHPDESLPEQYCAICRALLAYRQHRPGEGR